MAPDNIVLTDHARERMSLRSISAQAISQTVAKPDRKEKEDDGDTQFIRKIKGRQYHVVAYYLSDERKWLVKTTWVRGEDDPQPLWLRLLNALIGRLRR